MSNNGNEVKFVANFKKNKQSGSRRDSDEDSFSHKTMSIRDMDDDEEFINPRETQKFRDGNSKIYNKNRINDNETNFEVK